MARDEGAFTRITDAKHDHVLDGLRARQNGLKRDRVAIGEDDQPHRLRRHAFDDLDGRIDGGAEIGRAGLHHVLDRQAVEDIADEFRIMGVHHHGMRLGIEADHAIAEVAADTH